MNDWQKRHFAASSMSEQEYRELEPLYDEAKKEIPLMTPISISAVQRKYRLGYNRAARLLEQLSAAGVLEWNRMTGAWRSAQARGNA